MNSKQASIPIFILLLSITFVSIPVYASDQSCDLGTLACKVAIVNSTPGLNIQMSNFVQAEADEGITSLPTTAGDPITPTHVLSSPLDGVSISAPEVTVNQDTHAATQNEPAIAVDPNNHDRIVAAANDYVTRTWTCTIGGIPCSALGDGYSGTYFSNDGGATWCCVATDTTHLGTLIPGVEHLTGGMYDAGGDPAVAFNSVGNVFYAGLGFDRTSPPNTVEVSKGTFDGGGALTWGAPTFINPTTSPAIFNDKEWIGVDSHGSSPFTDNVYVSWTRFVFSPNGREAVGGYVQSPIFFVRSTDGGATFSDPVSIVGNVLYDQGSHIVVGSDGTIYVFWDGATHQDITDSIWMVKSTDGGLSFSSPVAVAPLIDISTPRNTVFRVNSFPMADIAPDGTLYVTWSAEITGGSPATDLNLACFGGPVAGCYAAAVFSKSTDGGSTWTSRAFVFTQSFRTNVGYPQPQPGGGFLTAPGPIRADSFFPSVAVGPNGHPYFSAYIVDKESPWQRCATPAAPTAVGRINCLVLDNYINNGRLDYWVKDLTTGVATAESTHPINSRYQFGGGFIGDYTGIAVGSDNVFHAVWTDTNNVQTVTWWYGFQFVPTLIHQQDIGTGTGSF